MSDSLQPPWTVAHRLHGIFQARSTGVGCHPPGDHQDPGSNRHLLNLLRWQVDSSPLAPPSQKQPFILCLIILVSLPGTLFYLFIYFAIPCGMWDLSSAAAATAAKSLQLCPTLRDPIDGSPPGSPVPGILQPRTLEWVASFFLQGIFQTQGLNPGVLHCRQILYHLSHQGSPILTIISSDIFSHPFFFSSSGTLIIQMLVCLMLFQRSLRLFSFPFIVFFILLCFSCFHHSIFQLTYPFFCLSYSIGSL